MTLVPLGDVLERLESGARPTGGVSGDSGEVPSLGGEHLNGDGGFDFTCLKRIPRAFFEKMRAGRIAARDILVVKDGATTGKTSFVGEDFPFPEAAVNEHVFCVRVDQSKAYPEYVFQFLRSPFGQRAIALDFRGATVGGISRDFAKKARLALPPLSEQRRIAEILDKADALRAKRRAALAQLDALIQSIFLDMFGDPATNPKEWPRVPVGEISDGATNWNPSSSPQAEFVYVDIAAIDQRKKRITGARRMLGGDSPSRARQLIRAGDVLVSTVRPNLNAVAMVPSVLDGATASTGFCVLRPRERRLNSEYLFALVRGRAFIGAMVRRATGASYPAVTDSIIRAWAAPCPPLRLQHEYAQRVGAVTGVQLRVEASLGETEALFASLQDSAFLGRP